MLIIILNYKNFSNKIILIQLKLNFKKSHFQMQLNQLYIQLHPILPNTFIKKNHSKSTLVCLVFRHNFSTHVIRDVILYATLRGCISVEDALIDVWFSLLGLSYSLAYTYKVLEKLFFSCTVDFKWGGTMALDHVRVDRRGYQIYKWPSLWGEVGMQSDSWCFNYVHKYTYRYLHYCCFTLCSLYHGVTLYHGENNELYYIYRNGFLVKGYLKSCVFCKFDVNA